MLLFDVNDVFNNFSDAFQAKFGVRPDQIEKAEYDQKVATLVRTDFYATLARDPVGVEMLRWAKTYRDKQASLILVNEATSPTWVNSEKVKFVDAICVTLGIAKLGFSVIKDLSELAGHSYRGVFLSRNNEHRKAWDQGTRYKSVYLEEDNYPLMKQLIEMEYQRN